MSTLGIELDVAAKETLSYAMAHNRIPVVDGVRVSNPGHARSGCTLVIELRDADGPLGAPHKQILDLPESGATGLTEVGLRLDPAAMLQLDERRPGQLVVRLEHSGDVLAEQRRDVTLLAAKQWLAMPQPLAFELLTAFVMPNDPAVQTLLAEASSILQRETGSPSLEGYQSGPERVDHIVAAVTAAMQARHIRYAEPPASWGEIGQKVRTPSDVLDGHVGTCLDTTVVLAAALEQAGIRPVLWVVQGHAFLGYWRQELTLDGIVQTEVADVVNYIDLGAMQLVETTMLTVRDEQVPFSATHRPPYVNYLSGDLSRVFGAIDVWNARMNGVVPLPARRTTDSGVQVHEYRPPDVVRRERLETERRAHDHSSTTPQSAVPARVQQWKNSLLDLSLRNRLINYTTRSSIDLRVPHGDLERIEDVLHASKSLTLLPSDQVEDVHRARGVRVGQDLDEDHLSTLLNVKSQLYSDVLSAGYVTRFRGLAHKARTIVEETGANNLYVALGSLVWDIEGREVRSPLILVPVRLSAPARTKAYRLDLDESGGSTPNYCLLEKLRQVHGLALDGLENLVEDDHGVDVALALDSVRRSLAAKGLPYRVEDTASLSILQFAKFRLWKDLDDHWSAFMQNSLVKHLVETPNEVFDDPVATEESQDLDALDAQCPIPADASQLEAIHGAVAGRTFVLEGPPGTGKSQTITNLLTRAVASGKRVLFVAEKRAALDVVFSRLDAVGMRPFCLDLHDKGSKPTIVRAQVRQALDHAVAVDAPGLKSDEEQLRAARRNLARYAERLHAENRAGMSFYKSRTTLLALGADGPVLDVPREVVEGDPAALDSVAHALRQLPETADLAHPTKSHGWGFVTLATDDEDAVRALHQAARACDAALAEMPDGGPLASVVRPARHPNDLAAVVSFARRSGVLLSELDQTRTSTWVREARSIQDAIANFASATHPGMDQALPSVLDLPLRSIDEQARLAAASGFFGRKKRLLAVLDQLRPGLRPDAQVKPKELPALTTSLVATLSAAESLATRAGKLQGLRLPAGWNPLTEAAQTEVRTRLTWLEWAGRRVDPSGSPSSFVSALRNLVDSDPVREPADAETVLALADALRGLLAAAGPGADAAWDSWLGEVDLFDRWQATSGGRDLKDPSMLSLRRWTAFLGALEPLRGVGAEAAHAALREGAVSADDAPAAWERGVAQVSLEERARSTGLDGFDPEAHNRTVDRFALATRAVRGHMTAEIPRQVLDNRPFRSGGSRGQVGALQRELAKQRRGLGVRALLQTYGDLITQVMPCVLVSPDSVSRFFPVGSQTFDLVVFDEASQIRVADAVGAMGRARSVVVVGDSKQMPPTSFAESTGGFEDDALVEDALAIEDQESILSEAVQSGVPRRWLSWHYRSQDESLIAFSNLYYYEDRLSSFPAPVRSRVDKGLGVSLVRVDGKFLRSGKGKLLRTNPVEAQTIVEEITRRFDATAPEVPSIGVVTFNQQQRSFIESLIRDGSDDRLIEALDGQRGEGLFIKNLENVQGDERDVILFSTAFSVNDKGVLPLNFGPLTRAGGERRLNVAVTRARRQVVIFSSFDPQQLRAEDTQSVGIKHLRSYLDMAVSGPGALERAARRPVATDRHRDQIADALRARGLVVETNVGLSEFKIDMTLAAADEADQPLVAVLLDGEGWVRRRTVGDRDGLPVQVLRNLLRWPAVERVWMPSWLANPEPVIDRLVEAVLDADAPHLDEPSDAVGSQGSMRYVDEGVADEPLASPSTNDQQTRPATDGTSRPSPTVTALRSVELVPVRVEDHALPGESDFAPWRPQTYGGREVLDSLPSRPAAILVTRALEAVIAAEGPVQHERLAKLVASAFGLSRVRPDRMSAILRHLPSKARADDPGFAWPTNLDPTTWSGFRRSKPTEPRPIEEVSLREIGNAMIAVCAAYAGADREELSRESLAVFGGKRLTPGIRHRLDEALALAERQGRLRCEPSGLYVV